MSAAPNILPNSRAKAIANRKFLHGVPYVPIYCANCGVEQGHVTEEGYDFAFALCNPCADRPDLQAMLNQSGHYMIPDEVFWQKCKDAQLEEFGRELFDFEIIDQLVDGQSTLSKLARDRADFNKE